VFYCIKAIVLAWYMPYAQYVANETATFAIGLHMSDKEVRVTSMRITSDVTALAKIAASFKGQTILEYVSDAVRTVATLDIEEFRRGGGPAKSRNKKGGT
jgi:hypothetical protein